MTHTALANDAVLGFVVFFTLLLVSFLYEVITTPLGATRSPEQPATPLTLGNARLTRSVLISKSSAIRRKADAQRHVS
jgi:hypothetical protein